MRMLATIQLLLCLVVSAARAADTIHVVFDIDWTLVYPLEQAPARPDPRAVLINGKWYRYTDGAAEALEELSRMPGVKISFFSGGDTERNRALLKNLKLPSGKRAEDIAEKILGADDMTAIDPDVTKKFSERMRKDLRKISPDLDQVILVDDMKAFALEGQEKNMYWLGQTYNFAPNYEAAARRAADGSAWEAPSKESWLLEREKLRRFLALFKRARERSPSHSLDALRSLKSAQDCNDLFWKLARSKH